MPDNDAMRKVNPGDPLVIPAGAYNRFIDTAVASERGGLVPSAGKRGPSQLAAGVVYGQNGAGVSATAGTAVSITQTLGSRLAFFARPTAEPYGILLDAAAAGGLARVATTGGPWQVMVHEAIVAGDRLEPVASGYAELKDGGPLLAMSVAAHGLCWVVFALGQASLVAGTHIVLTEEPSGQLQISESGTRADSTQPLAVQVWPQPTLHAINATTDPTTPSGGGKTLTYAPGIPWGYVVDGTTTIQITAGSAGTVAGTYTVTGHSSTTLTLSASPGVTPPGPTGAGLTGVAFTLVPPADPAAADVQFGDVWLRTDL